MVNFLNRTVSRLNKLEPQEFFGICKILGVELYLEKDKPKDGAALLSEVIEKIGTLNRVQKRNFEKLLKTATKGR